METKNPIQVANRIFQVMEYLAQHNSCGLLELSTSLNLNKTTVHRILNSLIYMGYVKQDSDTSKYSPTLKICSLSNQILASIDITDVARPYLKELVKLSGETVHLVQLDGVQAVYIDKVESHQNSVRLISRIGKSVPLYCSGVGKAMLADMEETRIQSIWQKSQINKWTSYTITDFHQFQKELEQIRINGYALDCEENELGVRCIAASLKDYSGSPKYAFSISAPSNRMGEEHLDALKPLILETKQKIISSWNE